MDEVDTAYVHKIAMLYLMSDHEHFVVVYTLHDYVLRLSFSLRHARMRVQFHTILILCKSLMAAWAMWLTNSLHCFLEHSSICSRSVLNEGRDEMEE